MVPVSPTGTRASLPKIEVMAPHTGLETACGARKQSLNHTDPTKLPHTTNVSLLCTISDFKHYKYSKQKNNPK